MRTATMAFAIAVLVASNAAAAVIGNWDGSARSWNSGPTLVDLMTSRGHTVEADAALTAANLANDDVFVIGEATRATSAQETADLAAWLSGGGRLLITVDSSGTGAAGGNSILSALGSSLSFAGSAVNGPLLTGSFLTEGGPFNIVGQSLDVTPGTAVAGGTLLAGSYVGFEKIGLGYIFAFGDHFQNDFFANSAANVNGQMHINLVEAGTVAPIPLPAPFMMLASALAGLGLLRLRKE